MKARWIYEFGLALTQARANIRNITLPLFLMHGSLDRLVPISASEFIQANIGSQDVQYEVSDKAVVSNDTCGLRITYAMMSQESLIIHISWQVFADNNHEILRDKDQDRAIQLIANWILAHSN